MQKVEDLRAGWEHEQAAAKAEKEKKTKKAMGLDIVHVLSDSRHHGAYICAILIWVFQTQISLELLAFLVKVHNF